jgi:hypothetical protein
MAETKGSAGLWIAGIAGLIAIGTWFVVGGTGDDPARRDVPAVRETQDPPVITPPAATSTPAIEVKAAAADSGVRRIAAHGKLTLEHAALPTEGPLTLDLDLLDEFRGSSERAVRIISTDGRRMDSSASPLPGAGSGVRMEIDPSFLSPGRYMIEIDTVGKHPLQIRRYVLELR